MIAHIYLIINLLRITVDGNDGWGFDWIKIYYKDSQWSKEYLTIWHLISWTLKVQNHLIIVLSLSEKWIFS